MYLCNNCWNESLKWQWQCPICKEWNSLVEFKESKITQNNWWNKWELKTLSNLDNVISENKEVKIITKSSEFNNVLGWGIVPGWVILLSWEPGIWKSTITLHDNSAAKFCKREYNIYLMRRNKLSDCWES